MVLLDDRENRLMGALDQIAAGRAPFYDFSLMMDSGSIKGWFLQEENIFDAVADILAQLKAQSRAGMLYAMGDGQPFLCRGKGTLGYTESRLNCSPEGIASRPVWVGGTG